MGKEWVEKSCKHPSQNTFSTTDDEGKTTTKVVCAVCHEVISETTS